MVTHKSGQYTAFYDPGGHVVLAKRELGSDQWQVRKTPYRGNVKDAHNVISLLPDGNLIFLYRRGASGNGNLMMNRYDTKTPPWTALQHAFVNAEGERNAYWQMCIDAAGTLHLSWVWRETADVATNHDIAYAKSSDGGKTWQKSTGERYDLPITQATAEYAARVPQNHELINTTSMCANRKGRPYIVTYWRDADADLPQYRLVYPDGTGWQNSQIGQRKTPFRRSGGGSKRIPISRPRIAVDSTGQTDAAYMLFGDADQPTACPWRSPTTWPTRSGGLSI